jgi:hypothetical protein
VVRSWLLPSRENDANPRVLGTPLPVVVVSHRLSPRGPCTEYVYYGYNVKQFLDTRRRSVGGWTITYIAFNEPATIVEGLAR